MCPGDFTSCQRHLPTRGGGARGGGTSHLPITPPHHPPSSYPLRATSGSGQTPGRCWLEGCGGDGPQQSRVSGCGSAWRTQPPAPGRDLGPPGHSRGHPTVRVAAARLVSWTSHRRQSRGGRELPRAGPVSQAPGDFLPHACPWGAAVGLSAGVATPGGQERTGGLEGPGLVGKAVQVFWDGEILPPTAEVTPNRTAPTRCPHPPLCGGAERMGGGLWGCSFWSTGPGE